MLILGFYLNHVTSQNFNTANIKLKKNNSDPVNNNESKRATNREKTSRKRWTTSRQTRETKFFHLNVVNFLQNTTTTCGFFHILFIFSAVKQSSLFGYKTDTEWMGTPCDMCCNARITYLYYGDTNLHYSRCIINCTWRNKSDRFLLRWHHFRWPPVAFLFELHYSTMFALLSSSLACSLIHARTISMLDFSISFVWFMCAVFVRLSWMRDTNALCYYVSHWSVEMVLLLLQFFSLECSTSLTFRRFSHFFSFFFVCISFSCWNVITIVWLRVQFLFILVN